MKLSRQTIILTGIAAIAFLVIWMSVKGKIPTPTSSPTPTLLTVSSVYKTQTNEGGNVTIIVTPKQLTAGKPAVFELVFDTHSVDLNFDVPAAAEIRDDQENTFGRPIWTGDPPGGHHRKGTLSFSIPLTTTSIALTLKDIAGVKERTFIWKL